MFDFNSSLRKELWLVSRMPTFDKNLVFGKQIYLFKNGHLPWLAR